MKPKHQGGYTEHHANLCERALVTLLRGLGPWRAGIYLTGGLVPRYLIPQPPDHPTQPPHVGTTDVDLVLDLEVLAEVEAYRHLEQNLTGLGFVRGTNDDGRAQHYSWRKPAGTGITIVVDLLCDVPVDRGGRAVPLPNERRLSALGIPGAHLVVADHVEIELTVELLEDRGVATERIRVANIVPFIVLKALAYEDRLEQKDAYDIIYSLMHYQNGPADVAAAYADRLLRWIAEPLLAKSLDILRTRFAGDERTDGHRKDGPSSYALFLTDPGRRDLDLVRRRDAAAVVEEFLRVLAALTASKPTGGR